MPRTPRKPGTADGEGLGGGSAGSGTPRLALPGNLPRSLRYLDDGQLDELLRAAAAEARRRGWKVQAEPHRGRPKRDVSESSESAPRPASRSSAQPVSPGLERIVRAALAAGARQAGQWAGCHATPIDADAPPVGDLRCTDALPRRSYPLGITVNLEGERFADEGQGFAEQSFVTIGSLILRQTDGVAFQVFDAKALPHLEPRYGGALRAEADDAAGLARRLGIEPDALTRTVDGFNAAAHRAGYEPRRLDGRSTTGLRPTKSNWAVTLDVPPFVAFTVTGGITYTYGGLKISTRAEVLDRRDRAIPGLFAAGEIVGGIFLHNSLRAAGLMHGSVFGRLAGIHAARRG